LVRRGNSDPERAGRVASQIIAGHIYINGDMDLLDVMVPSGGRKSGNGREFGAAGFEAFTEPRVNLGYYSSIHK